MTRKEEIQSLQDKIQNIKDKIGSKTNSAEIENMKRKIKDYQDKIKELQESYTPTFRELLLGEDKKKDDDRNRCDKCGRVTQDPDSPLCDRCISSFNKGMSGNKTGKRKPK